MDSSERLGTNPFAAADVDIDMIDRLHTPNTSNNGSSGPAPGGNEGGNPVTLARQVTAAVEDLVRRLNEQDAYRKQLEMKLRSVDENSRAYDALKNSLREAATADITAEDLQSLQRVLQALAQDPNHIMVLASVAQQVGKLQAVLTSFTKLHNALQQAPPQ